MVYPYLIETGILQDNIFHDKTTHLAEVNIRQATDPAAFEILKDHNPEKSNWPGRGLAK